MSGGTSFAKSDRGFFVVIAAFSIAVLFGPMALGGYLYNDTLRQYSFFYDNLDSLSRYAEPAWWSPQLNFGTPTYFYALLGISNTGKPVFVVLGLIVWLLGRLGIELPFVFPVFMLYFGVLVPLMFLIGIQLVAGQLLRSRTAVRYTLVVASFSPSMLMTLSDPGALEYSAYTLYCAAAFLHFVGRPSSRSFAILCLSALLISISPSHSLVATALPLLPMLVVASAIASRPVRRALRQIQPLHAIAALVLVLATTTPSLLAYLQQKNEIVRAKLGALEYPYAGLKPGNPLEFLLASTPAIAFQWDRYTQDETTPPSENSVRPIRWREDAGYGYLGLLAAPLAAVGLLYGRRRLRLPLFLMLAFGSMVVLLSAYSPFFAPILALPSPLRSYNHFGELFYPGGGFLLLLFAAALGLEAVERRPVAFDRLLPLFGVASVASLSFVIGLGQRQQSLLGLSAVLIAAFAIVLVWARRLPRRSRSRLLARGIVVLTLVDVSTSAFWYARLTIHGSPNSGVPEGRVDGLRRASAAIAHMFLLRTTDEMLRAGLSLDQLPEFAGFCSAHTQPQLPTSQDLARAIEGPLAQRSLALTVDVGRAVPLQPFLTGTPRPSCEFQLISSRRSYNAARVKVATKEPELLFVRSAHSRYWKATVNGIDTPIYPAFGGFMAVVVPAGKSDLQLRFAPPFVLASLLGSYGILLVSALVVWRWPRQYTKIDQSSGNAGSVS
jgi:hypothetical protein